MVPGEITVLLLKKKMTEKGSAKPYLIDGFPRNQENVDDWGKIVGDSVDVPFVLFFDTDEEALI